MRDDLENKPSLERRLKTVNHVVTEIGNKWVLSPKEYKGLVISGGGARGIVYAGMIEEMSKGGFLEGLTHVSGASAGAMTASLVAVGLKAEEIKQIIQQLNVKRLMDREGRFRLRAKGDRFRNALEIIYMWQIEKHIASIDPAKAWPVEIFQLNRKIEAYRKALAAAGLFIYSLEDLIALSNSQDIVKIDEAFSLLNQKDPSMAIEFADLGVLRSFLPRSSGIKSLNVVVVNQSTQSLETYNEEYSAPLAEIVQISGAHPLMFSPRVDKNGHSKADGGILDNMPLQSLVAAGLDPEEILCVYTVPDSEFKKRNIVGKQLTPEELSTSSRVQDGLLSWFIGGAMNANNIKAKNLEKVCANTGGMLYLNSQRLTVSSLDVSQEQKDEAIQKARQQTAEFLNAHIKIFDHPLLAMIYLGTDKLNEEMLNHPDSVLALAASQAKIVDSIQKEWVEAIRDYEEYKKSHKYSLFQEASKQNKLDQIVSCTKMMVEMLQSFRPSLDLVSEEKVLALCLHQVDYMTQGALHYCMNYLAQKGYEDELVQPKKLLDLLNSMDVFFSTTPEVVQRAHEALCHQEAEEKQELAMG